MKRFVAQRRGMAITPRDEDGREAVRSLSPDRPVMVEVKQARSISQHRLYWGMVRLIHNNLPEEWAARYPRAENLSDAFKVEAGYYDQLFDLTKERVVLKPKSIAFENMDQAEFREFFDGSVRVAADVIIKDLDKTALLKELEEMLGDGGT